MKKFLYLLISVACTMCFVGCYARYPSYEDRLQEANSYMARVEIGMKKSEVRGRLKDLDRSSIHANTPVEFDAELWGGHLNSIFENFYPDTVNDRRDWIAERCSSALVYYYQYFGREKKFYEGKGNIWKIPDRLAIYFDKDEKVIGWSYEVDKH